MLQFLKKLFRNEPKYVKYKEFYYFEIVDYDGFRYTSTYLYTTPLKAYLGFLEENKVLYRIDFANYTELEEYYDKRNKVYEMKTFLLKEDVNEH